jgi:hypothetical protein
MSCWFEIDRDAGHPRLSIGEVRHLLSPGQSSITLPDLPAVNLPIAWIWRSGGCFGSQSSAAANQRQRVPRDSRSPMPMLDRGTTGGWLALWLCPCCGRRARVLVNPLMNWVPAADAMLSRHWPYSWRCLRCCRYRYASQKRPGSHSGQPKPPQWHYAAHMAAIDRIEAVIATPQRLTRERRQALEQLRCARYALGVAALRQALPCFGGWFPPADNDWAWQTIRRCQWALRQSSWHRAGRPRPGPDVPGR